jgi:hypothetical protein
MKSLARFAAGKTLLADRAVADFVETMVDAATDGADENRAHAQRVALLVLERAVAQLRDQIEAVSSPSGRS